MQQPNRRRSGATRPGLTADNVVYGRHQPQRSRGDGVAEVVVPLAVGTWWVLRALGRHPWATLLGAGILAAYVGYGPVGVVVLVAALAVLLVAWRYLAAGSFGRLVGQRARGAVRGWWIYGRRWTSAMTMSDLGDVYELGRYVPKLRKVRSTRWADRLSVQLLQGQKPGDYADRAEALAHTFGMLDCRARIAGPGMVLLDFLARDPLAPVVAALPISEVVDLGAVPIGVGEDGVSWTVKVRGSHTLIGGATGSGKGSVVWSIVRGLCPAIRDRWVQLWVVDPKGGMELAPGEPLFHRFACDSAEDMADLLEEVAGEMHARARRLRGHTRLHTPSVDEPLIVVVVDELAALSAYADRDTSKRLAAVLPLLLSQGRAVGVVVIGALQDPRKEIVGFRDLFPTRIALALTEDEHTDMVLGDGARDRGAHCARISLATQQGVAWVWAAGEPEPTRKRASWVTDDDIAHMAAHYRPGATPPPGTGRVIDLQPVSVDSVEVVA